MTPAAAPTRIWDFLCRYRLWLLGGLAALTAVDLAWVTITYLVYPGYLDHGEPSVALISWRLLDGVAAFPAFDAPGATANIYGPLTYVTHAAAFALLGPSPAVGKAVAVIAAAAVPVAVFLGQRRRGIEAALIGALLAAALVLLHLPASIWNRPDSFVALLAAVAVWAANAADANRAEWPKSILIAVCGGLAVGFKIFGGLYIAPVVICHCLNPNRGIRAFAAMCAVGAALAILPFAFATFALGNYLSWLMLLTGKASLLDYLLSMLRYGTIYLAPAVFFVAAGSRTADAGFRREAAYLGAYLACFAAVLYLGAKPGAGIHYFYPFAALTVDLMLRNTLRIPGRRMAAWGAMVAVVAVVLAIGVPVQKRYHRALHWDRVAAVQAEIRAVMAKYPDRTIEMGVGADLASYRDTFYRTLLVLAGHPYTLDVGVMIEWSSRGIPVSEVTLAMIRGCSTDAWLIPKGERPFAMIGYYGNPIFEPAFVDAFLGSYAKAESFEFFDVWACKR